MPLRPGTSLREAQHFEIGPGELMAWIQTSRLSPALPGPCMVALLVRDVAQLEVQVITELRVELGRALIRFRGLVVAAVSVENVGQVFGYLRQCGILGEGRPQHGLGA